MAEFQKLLTDIHAAHDEIRAMLDRTKTAAEDAEKQHSERLARIDVAFEKAIQTLEARAAEVRVIQKRRSGRKTSCWN